jgi:uncharacterized protein with HEPN domain
MRNLLIHAYRRVETEEVWRVSTAEIAALIAYLEPLLPPEP